MKNIMYNIKLYKRKYMIIASMAIVAILITFGVSYAYLSASFDETQITDINASVGNIESFTYTPGDTLTFSSAAAGQSGTTHPSATLMPGAGSQTIESTYDLYLDISANTFTYTTDGEKTAELLLKIIDPSGNEVTEAAENSSLQYVTVDGQSGFDVTNITGFFPIKLNHPISSNDSVNGTTQEWDITLTYVDLPIDQSHNNNKSFTGSFVFDTGVIHTLPNLILEHNGGKERIESYPQSDFTKVAVSTETYLTLPDVYTATVANNMSKDRSVIESGMFATTDDYGTSYYFRGEVSNNWVYFAGIYWRIVRINGDGSVRLIYSGTTQPTSAQAEVMTGAGTQITAEEFNVTYNYAEHVGYMYTIGQQHGLSTDSNAKTYIDAWYKTNIYDTGYYGYISDTLFCGDRTAYTNTAGTTAAPGTGTGGSTQYFGNYIRNIYSKNPVLECPNRLDAYTVSDEVNGNGALTYPVAMLSMDEVAMAGGRQSFWNYNYYLFTNSDYWVLSPFYYSSNYAYGFYVIPNGHIGGDGITGTHGLRPVLNLNSNILASGTGTWNDPYTIY